MSDNVHPPVVIMNANELSAPDEFEFLIYAVNERFIIIIGAVYLMRFGINSLSLSLSLSLFQMILVEFEYRN